MSKSSVLTFNGGSVGEGGSCNVHNLQLGVMTVNLPDFHTSSMYVLLDKSIPIESAPGYAPVDRYTLADWIQQGDVIQVDCANITSETDTSYAGALQSTTAVNQQGHVYTNTCTIRLDTTSNNHTESRYYRLEAVHDTLTDIWYLGQDVNEVTTIINENASNKVQSLDNNSSHYPSCPAVKEAIETTVSSVYHAAGPKTVAQLTSALLVAANQGDVYNITDSGTTTADFVEGAGHPIAAGDNVGICDVGGGVYKFDLLSGFVDLSGYLAANGDGSDVTASFTAASTRTNVVTGEKLSALFGKVAKWFGDLKALAFKDKVTDSDISGTISDTHIASASTWNAKANDSSVVHLAGTETIQGNKIFKDLWPLLASESATVSAHKVPLFLDRGTLYADWTQEQKDGNHYRRWRIAISPLYATYYVIKISLVPGYSNSSGVGLLEKVVVTRPRTPTGYVAVYGAYTAAVGVAPTEFRINNVHDDSTWGRVIEVISSKPQSDNNVGAVVEILNYGNTYANQSKPIVQVTADIIEGWPSWAGDPNVAPRAQSNGLDVMLNGDNADSATDATYSTKIGSNSSHPAIGSATQPVYVDRDGSLQPCTLKGVYLSQYNADSLSNIIDAFDSGLLVFSKYAGDVYLLLDADSNGATFVCNTTVDGKTYYSTLTVNSSNTWSRTTENIFNNIIVRKHYGANHEASVITTATDISNGYVEYALDFTDMFFGGGNSILFISLPNESTLAYYFTSIEVMTYPYTTDQNSIDICKFTDLTHDDDGNAIGANDEYTWLRTCNSPNYIQRIKGLKLRCHLNTTSGMTWQAGIELKLKLDFNAVRFDKL